MMQDAISTLTKDILMQFLTRNARDAIDKPMQDLVAKICYANATSNVNARFCNDKRCKQ